MGVIISLGVVEFKICIRDTSRNIELTDIKKNKFMQS